MQFVFDTDFLLETVVLSVEAAADPAQIPSLGGRGPHSYRTKQYRAP